MTLALLPCLGAGQDRNRPGPWDGDGWIYESPDGIRFTKSRKLVEGAGVPTLITDARGRLVALFQWFPKNDEKAFDRVAVCFSKDAGRTWTAPRPIVVEGFPETLMRPFDPTVVLLEDGRFRLYYTGVAKGKRTPPAIYSAISDDAITFRFEPGVRFGVDGEFVIDCAAARLGREWHLFAPVQGRDGVGYHAVSTDGLRFERRKDVDVAVRGTWLGCAVNVGEKLRFYGSGDRGWSATSSDGAMWTRDDGASREGGADPGVARLADGRWLMIATEGNAGPRQKPSEFGAEAAVNLGDHLYVLRDGKLVKIDLGTGKRVGELPVDTSQGGSRKAYFDYMRSYDSARAPKRSCRVFDPPRTVSVGRLSRVGQGGFPRLLWVGGRIHVFLSIRDRAWIVRLGEDLKPDGLEKTLTPKGARWID